MRTRCARGGSKLRTFNFVLKTGPVQGRFRNWAKRAGTGPFLGMRMGFVPRYSRKCGIKKSSQSDHYPTNVNFLLILLSRRKISITVCLEPPRALHGEDGKDYIIELNGTACGFLANRWEEDTSYVLEVVQEKLFHSIKSSDG